jgi:hypothetical protein
MTAMMADWFDAPGHGGFPVERAELGSCDLLLMQIADTWCWLVRRDGQDVAEGVAGTADDARLLAEAAARKLD